MTKAAKLPTRPDWYELPVKRGVMIPKCEIATCSLAAIWEFSIKLEGIAITRDLWLCTPHNEECMDSSARSGELIDRVDSKPLLPVRCYECRCDTGRRVATGRESHGLCDDCPQTAGRT